jgi:hypothetical protein
MDEEWDRNYQRPGIGWNTETNSRNMDTLLGWTSRDREVIHWPNYGVVCPDQVTTNGSVYTLFEFGAAPVRLTPPGVAYFIGRAFSLVGRYRRRGDHG